MEYLIVVDMQNDFIDGSLGSAEAQAIVPAVAEKIKNFKGQVITTMDTHFDNYLEETLEGTKLPVIHCLVGTEGYKLNKDINAAIEDREGDTFNFYKETFGSNELVRYLVGEEMESWVDIELIELCGLCTDICVVSNALLLRAAFPNAVIQVDATLTAGATPETKAAALTTMKMCQIDIINE